MTPAEMDSVRTSAARPSGTIPMDLTNHEKSGASAATLTAVTTRGRTGTIPKQSNAKSAPPARTTGATVVVETARNHSAAARLGTARFLHPVAGVRTGGSSRSNGFGGVGRVNMETASSGGLASSFG